MDNESELIREQMEQTRSALQDKLETLEQQVTDTVQDVTDTVQGAAEAATETVQTVKEAVESTVETVKDSLEETVVSVKQSLNLARHVEEHPCIMFFGAVGVGFMGTRLLSGPKAPSKVALQPTQAPADSMHASTGHRNGKNRPPPTRKAGLWQRIANHYSEELAKVEGLAVGAAAAIIREALTSSAPPAFAQQISEILDGVTTKLGGTPIRGPLFQASAPAATKEHQSEVECAEQLTNGATANQNKPQRR